MKKVIISSLLLVALPFWGCENELDKLPKDRVIGEDFYKTPADAFAAVTAAYDPLQYNYTTSVFHFRFFFGDFCSDDAIKGGSGPTDQAQLEALSNLQTASANIHVNAEYVSRYIGIYRTNLVIQNVPNIEMDETLKARYVAEAKFIRAFHYFNLVTMFGDVPLVDHTLAPSEYGMARTPKAQIWAFIENDLTEAAADLPNKSEYAPEDLGRVTKGAAHALLAKSYLFQEKWAEAKAAAQTVITSGEYQLTADYSKIFTNEGENNEESVFEIQRSSQSGGHWGNVNASNEGTLISVFQRARGQFGGWGFNIPTQNLADEFEAGDPRKKATMFSVGDQMGDRGVFTKEATGNFPYDYYSKKYFINAADQAQAVGDQAVNGEANDRVIRYADVLLMHAEASYRTGDEASAKQSLNLVRARARAGQPPFVLPDVTASGQALLDAIWHERRVELALEGHRFFDLVRQKRAGTVLRAYGKNFVDGKHELFPIPNDQIQLTNGALAQNPGY